ncbi:MAG: N-acetylneuraminate synthase family protein [Magnetococcales bacterium]|nr:N-acetylneuraminate synthase family protein [Magnetococcales bacterium]
MLFIAEIGMNHNGHFALAGEMFRQAKLAGADVVKMQLGWRDGPGEINRLTPEIIDQLLRIAAFYDIELLFSVIRPDAWEMLQPFQPKRVKIASRTVIDYPELVRGIIATGLPVIVSLGMWPGETPPFGQPANVEYLWCRSSYPAYPWDLTGMPKSFTGSPCAGYSDHSLGIEVPLLAIARGARIIEKHFTLDKSDTTIRDHVLSATPEEFARLVTLGRAMHRYLQAGV